MKKNILKVIAGLALIFTIVVGTKFNNGNKGVALDEISKMAVACQEMTGLSGGILLMENCYSYDQYLDGEEWVEVHIHGCDDANDTCFI